MQAETHLNAKKQLNVRVDHDVFAQIEATGRSKQAVVTDALKLYFEGCPEPVDSVDIAIATDQLAVKDGQLAASAAQIAELHILLQTSIKHQQKLLPAAAREHWWQIWRKNL